MAAIEFGLFSDEGMVDGPFYSLAEAEEADRERYSPEDELIPRAICPWHEEQARDACEECESE